MFRWHTEAWASVIVISKTHGSSVFIWGNCEAHAQRNSLHPSVNSGELKLASPSLCINKWSWRDIDSSPRRDDTDVKPACQVLFACLCDLYSTQVSQSVITSVYNRRLGYLTSQVNTSIDALRVFQVMFRKGERDWKWGKLFWKWEITDLFKHKITGIHAFWDMKSCELHVYQGGRETKIQKWTPCLGR